MNFYFDFVSLSISLMAVVVSLFGLSHNRIEAINAFFENDRSEALLKAREIVHNLEEGYDPFELMRNHGSEVAFLIISYNQAAVLIQKCQLPFWIFSKQASSGYAVIQFWEKLKPYVDLRREGGESSDGEIKVYANPSYANPFENLYRRIKTVYIKQGV